MPKNVVTALKKKRAAVSRLVQKIKKKPLRADDEEYLGKEEKDANCFAKLNRQKLKRSVIYARAVEEYTVVYYYFLKKWKQRTLSIHLLSRYTPVHGKVFLS